MGKSITIFEYYLQESNAFPKINFSKYSIYSIYKFLKNAEVYKTFYIIYKHSKLLYKFYLVLLNIATLQLEEFLLNNKKLIGFLV